MKYDMERVRRLLDEQRQAVKRLEELSEMAEEEFLGDKHLISSAKYDFMVAIETAIDLCNHIISENRLRSPEDYADSFKVLQEAGIFNSNFVVNLIKMARFRNRLVHLYWKIDDDKVYESLKSNLADFEEFEKQLLAGIK